MLVKDLPPALPLFELLTKAPQATWNAVPPPPVGFQTESQIVKGMKEQISRMKDERAIRYRQVWNVDHDNLLARGFNPPQETFFPPTENKRRIQWLDEQIEKEEKKLSTYRREKVFLEDESVLSLMADSALEQLSNLKNPANALIAFTSSCLVKLKNRGLAGAIQEKFDSRDELFNELKENIELVRNKIQTIEKRLECVEKCHDLFKGLDQNSKEILTEIKELQKKYKDLIDADTLKEALENFQKPAANLLDAAHLHAYHQIANFMSDLYAIKDPANAQKFRVVSHSLIEICSHVENFRKCQDFILNMGSVAGIGSNILQITGILFFDTKDPMDVLSNQVRNVSKLLDQTRMEMHERFDRVESQLLNQHLETLEEFSKLKDLGITTLSICQSIQTKAALILKVAKGGFGAMVWSEYYQLESRTKTFVNDPRTKEEYLALLQRWCEISDTLSCHPTITGRQDRIVRTDDQVINSLSNEKLENVINYIADYFTPKKDYPNITMWVKSVYNYIYLRRYIRENLENFQDFESNLGEGHYKNFVRLFDKGTQLKKWVQEFQLSFATGANNSLSRQLEFYKKELEDLSKIGYTAFENKMNKDPLLFQTLQANYLLLINLIQLCFNSSFKEDHYFSSLLGEEGIAHQTSLVRLNNKLSQANNAESKAFIFEEFFLNQDSLVKILEALLKAKAKQNSDNIRAIDEALDQLYQLEDLIYCPAKTSSRLVQDKDVVTPPLLFSDQIPLFEDELIISAKLGRVGNVYRLSEKGVENRPDALGRIALHYAASKYIWQILLKANPELIKKQDKLGNTPLHLAAEYNRSEFFEILDENGNEALGVLGELLCRPNKAQKTPMMIAKENNGKFLRAAEAFIRQVRIAKDKYYREQPQLRYQPAKTHLNLPFKIGNNTFTVSSKRNKTIKFGCLGQIHYNNYELTIVNSLNRTTRIPLSQELFQRPLYSLTFDLLQYEEFYLLAGYADTYIILLQPPTPTPLVNFAGFLGVIDSKSGRVKLLEQRDQLHARGWQAVEALKKDKGYYPNGFEVQGNTILVHFQDRSSVLYSLDGGKYPLMGE